MIIAEPDIPYEACTCRWSSSTKSKRESKTPLKSMMEVGMCMNSEKSVRVNVVFHLDRGP